MERHLIIIDLDGTLMLDFSHYDQETIDYLNKLTRDGHIIMIATGRPLRSSFFVYQEDKYKRISVELAKI